MKMSHENILRVSILANPSNLDRFVKISTFQVYVLVVKNAPLPRHLTWLIKMFQDVSLVCSGFKFNLLFTKIFDGAMFGDIPLSLQMPSAVLASTTT